MATIDQMTQPTPGSNEFHPGKVFNPAVNATLTDLGGNQTLPQAQPNPLTPATNVLPDVAMEATTGTVPAGQVDPANGMVDQTQLIS